MEQSGENPYKQIDDQMGQGAVSSPIVYGIGSHSILYSVNYNENDWNAVEDNRAPEADVSPDDVK